MKNILNEGKGTIVSIKKELMVLEEYRERARAMAQKETKYEKELRQKEREKEDEIVSTIRKRRSDVEGTFDSQINKSKSQIKKVTSRREKSKDSKMNERIKDETSEYVSDNRMIKSDIKSILYKNKIPSICGTQIYFSLFRPRLITDFVAIAITIIFLLVALPLFVIKVTPWEEGMFLKVVLYMLIILIFGGLYIVVKNTLNSWHDKELKQIETKRKDFRENVKTINKITRKIRKDKDDSYYNLDKYDKQIDDINDELEKLIKEKKKALETFENSTKLVIENEIAERYENVLNDLKDNYENAKRDSDRLDDAVNKMTLDFSKKYEGYLGKDFMKVDKLDALIEIIDKKEAKTISEAIDVYKNRYKI